jgi:hypothetical protein
MTILVGSVAAVLVAPVVWRRRSGTGARASGRIARLKRDRSSDRSLTVDVELLAVPSTHQVWLALKAGGLLYPLAAVSSRGGRFTAELRDGWGPAPTRPNQILLLLVDAKGQRAIEYWLLQGGLGEGFPGFELVPGTRELDRKSLL